MTDDDMTEISYYSCLWEWLKELMHDQLVLLKFVMKTHTHTHILLVVIHSRLLWNARYI